MSITGERRPSHDLVHSSANVNEHRDCDQQPDNHDNDDDDDKDEDEQHPKQAAESVVLLQDFVTITTGCLLCLCSITCWCIRHCQSLLLSQSSLLVQS